MKIYKLLFLAVLSCFALSCSQDKLEEKTADSNERLAEGQYDNSYLGVYKGLFSTNDGLTRGSVVVTLNPTNEAIAQIKLSSGEIIELKSTKVKLTVDNNVENLRFSSVGLSKVDASLSFSVESNGVNPIISGVTFDNMQSDILIAKNSARAPLTTITGTYVRTAGTGGFPTNGRTWNVMSIGTGDQTYAAQIWFGGRLYNIPNAGTQSNCSDTGTGYDVCDINGSVTLLGRNVSWTGSHIYDNFDDNLGCSEVFGTWAAPTYGGSSGTFQSDSDCSGLSVVNDMCENATTISCDASASGTTDGATNTDTPDFCAENLFGGAGDASGPGVWFSFSTPVDQIVTIDLSDSDFDTQLRVFSGACGALVCVANDDDSGSGLTSLLSFAATGNEAYRIFIGGYANEVGNYVIDVTCEDVPPPAVFSLTPACGTTLVDNGEDANYANSSNDTYLIDAGDDNSVISLPFSTFNLENSWDFMRIYDGASTSDTEITSVNGRVIANYGGSDIGYSGTGTGANSLQGQTVTSSGRYLTIVFTSDGTGQEAGFFAVVGCNPARTAQSNKGMIKTSETFSPALSSSRTKGSANKVLEAVEIAKYNSVSGKRK